MKTRINLIALLLIVGNILAAQQTATEFPKLTGPYLGQKPPGMTPEIFAPGIVSTNGFEHSKIAFNKDGSAFYWAAQPDIKGANRFQQKIWFTKNNKDGWSNPRQLPITQIGGQSPTFSPIGDEIFFIGSDDKEVTDPHNIKNNLYKIDKEQNLVKNISDQFPMLTKSWSFGFAKNGNLYFDYKENNDKPYEIYFLEYKNGKYSEPQKMNDSINNGSQNIHPFISSDESFLIFSSFCPGGHGIADLYICFKDNTGAWTEAQNMGSLINTDMLERFPSISPDGKYLFFTRNKGSEISDFYWVSAKIIEELKPKE